MTDIPKLLKDCLGMPNEQGSILVEFDSLMNIKGYVHEERAKAAFEIIVSHIKTMPTPFLNAEEGWSFTMLPFCAHPDFPNNPGKRWGAPNDGAILCLICAYYGIVQDPLKTLGFREDCLEQLPGKTSYVSFNIESEFLDMVRRHLGLTTIITGGSFLNRVKKIMRF